MLKKICALFFFSMLCANVFAEGPYIGLTLGLNNTSYDLKDNFNDTYFLAVHYPTYGLFIGNGAMISPKYYLSGELFLNTGTGRTAAKTIDQGQVDAKITSTFSFGADVVPGLFITPATLLFGKLGLVGTRMRLGGGVNSQGLAAGLIDQGTPEKRFTGLRAGFGLQTGLTRGLKVRGEYIHTFYRALTMNDNAGMRIRLAPGSNQIALSLLCEFS